VGFLQSESRVERPLFHHDKLINQQICCQNTPTKLFDTDKSENLSQLKPIQQINSIFLKRLLSFKIELFEQKGKKLSKRAVVFLISFLPWNSSYLLKIRWSQPLEKKIFEEWKRNSAFSFNFSFAKETSLSDRIDPKKGWQSTYLHKKKVLVFSLIELSKFSNYHNKTFN